MLVVLGTEWIFLGLPTVKEKVTERSYTQNELTSQRKNEIIHRPKHFGETQYLCHLLRLCVETYSLIKAQQTC